MEHVLQTGQRCLDIFTPDFKRVHRMLAFIVGGHIVVMFANVGEPVQRGFCFLFELACINSHGGRHRDRNQDPGNGRMDPTFHEGQPNQQTKQQGFQWFRRR